MTTRAPPVLAPVFCEYCRALGRSITVANRDQFGNLFFVGKLLMALEVDRQAHQIKVPCRVCGHQITMPI